MPSTIGQLTAFEPIECGSEIARERNRQRKRVKETERERGRGEKGRAVVAARLIEISAARTRTRMVKTTKWMERNILNSLYNAPMVEAALDVDGWVHRFTFGKRWLSDCCFFSPLSLFCLFSMHTHSIFYQKLNARHSLPLYSAVSLTRISEHFQLRSRTEQNKHTHTYSWLSDNFTVDSCDACFFLWYTEMLVAHLDELDDSSQVINM